MHLTSLTRLGYVRSQSRKDQGNLHRLYAPPSSNIVAQEAAHKILVSWISNCTNNAVTLGLRLGHLVRNGSRSAGEAQESLDYQHRQQSRGYYPRRCVLFVSR